MSTTTPHPRKDNARIAAVSGFVGSALEYYDFFIFASAAALIFPRLFFPEGEPGVATLLSFATVGVAYVARPFGAVLWGHIGDRFGRKRALLACLTIMGVATFLVGCLPTWDTVGITAPITVVALRLVQGVSAGGESPGSSALTLEHAPDHRRAFFTSWTMSGIMLGIVVSSLVFIPIASMPEDDLLSWGWRVPFWASLLVTVVAIALRRLLDEPEVLATAPHGEAAGRLPLLTLLRHHGGTVVRVTLMSLYTAVNTMVNVFALAYGTSVAGIPRGEMLAVITVSNLTAVVVGPVAGAFSDRVGRKPVFLAGLVLQCALIYALLAAVDAAIMPLVWALSILLIGVAYTLSNAVYPAYFPEQFPARMRFTGMAVSLMLGLVLAGLTPAIAQTFVTGPGNDRDWPAVAWFTIAIVVVSVIATMFAPETATTPTALLGLTTPPKRAVGFAEHIDRDAAPTGPRRADARAEHTDGIDAPTGPRAAHARAEHTDRDAAPTGPKAAHARAERTNRNAPPTGHSAPLAHPDQPRSTNSSPT
ncbi:MFS transporter [Microbacterium sp. PRF11]|uniref:MFS transporter n=1 Tax=Microbacterium sp. PRF11 TaxID=2962593 RepID=UPI00288121B8|nr:MFS transporter [Microbacterium sp. PRF11]MDT0117707.1 MFS transporter [Microbacterium sp. PRF11]